METSIKNVLIVDDDPILSAQVVAYMAQHKHASVEEAANGIEAIQIVSRRSVPFDLIITDLNMPDNDGIEFLDSLARLKFQGSVAILSGETRNNIEMAEILAKKDGLNVVAALMKPVTLEQLERLSDSIIKSLAVDYH